MKNIVVEPFPQIGSSGCVTACLANIARKHLEQDITPADIDAELGRAPDGDITGFDRDAWILRRGLPLRLILAENPTKLDDYLDGVIDFRELLSNIAKFRHNGDMDLVNQHYNDGAYRQYVDAQAERKRMLKDEFAGYEEVGKLTFDRRQPVISDFKTAQGNGATVLYAVTGSTAVAHHEIAFDQEVIGAKLAIHTYSPSLIKGRLDMWPLEMLSERSIYMSNLAVVG
jgi:hypothetical protein